MMKEHYRKLAGYDKQIDRASLPTYGLYQLRHRGEAWFVLVRPYIEFN